jgi:CHAD domain-containing protein
MIRLARRLTPQSAPADFHRLRIRCKRLRYALEQTSPLYGDAAERYLRALVRVQDVLGAHQDAEVALARLTAIAEQGTRRLPAPTLVALGMLAERHAQHAAALREVAPEAVARLRGRRWRRLTRALIGQAATVVAGGGPR